MAKKESGWAAWNKKKAQKALRAMHRGYLITMAIFLIIGAIGGAAYAYIVTAKDEFTLIGERVTTVRLGETLVYEDEGIKCISMGKDLSDKVEIKTNMTRSADGTTFSGDTKFEGEYYVTYTVTEGRYAGLSRVRIFKITMDDDSLQNETDNVEVTEEAGDGR